MFAYGSLLRHAHHTFHSSSNSNSNSDARINGTKLTLVDDILNRQIHYVTDGGSLLNFCDYWPGCVKAPGTLVVGHATKLRMRSSYTSCRFPLAP